eukprot:4526353-Alexandrium_andersonii.AAC.1
MARLTDQGRPTLEASPWFNYGCKSMVLRTLKSKSCATKGALLRDGARDTQKCTHQHDRTHAH